MKRWTKQQQKDFDRYSKEGAAYLAEMLVAADAAYERMAKENARFRSVLTEIACYDEVSKGAKNLSRLDEPGAANRAREALEKKR